MLKPLGRKAYGHIPHLPGSQAGPGDHRANPGHARICTEKTRDRGDRVIVTEKLDGSNVAVANVDGKLTALQRSGYPAQTSPWTQHHFFAAWVHKNHDRFRRVLDEDGLVLHAEWLLQAHGRTYRLNGPPLVAFDLSLHGRRLPYDRLIETANELDVDHASVIHDGGALGPGFLATYESRHGAAPEDSAEGAVWRVERGGQFDFICKYVRPGAVPGRHLPDVPGKPILWNVEPHDLFGPWEP